MSENTQNTTTNNQSQSAPRRDFSRHGQQNRPAGPTGAGAPGQQNRSFGRRPFGSGGGNFKPGEKKFGGPNKRFSRDNRKPRSEENSNIESRVILVRRVTRVVKGGKRMRFSALVIAGDKAGKVGYGLKKGLDFQDAVAKATRQAQENLITVKINPEGSLDFPSKQKFKACELMLKPAKTGTGLIAGGFLRPVLELAGIQNIYSKIIASRNKVAGVQTAFEALKKYT